MTIFKQFFAAQLKGLLIWAAVGGLYALAITSSAASFINTNALAAMPPSLLKIMGDIGGLSPVDSYLAIGVAKGLILIPVLYAIILALSVVTREVDRRTVEFLLALPVGRTQVLIARMAVMKVNITAVVAVQWAVLRFTMAAQGFQGSWGHLGLLFLAIWLLSLAWGAVTLAISMWIDDYSVGVKLFLGVGALAYLLEYVLRAAGVSRGWRLVSPFSYVNVSGILRTGGMAWVDAAVLVLAIIAGLLVSWRAFDRKQFSV